MISGGDVTPYWFNVEIGNSDSTMKIISSRPKNLLDFEPSEKCKKINLVMETKGYHLVSCGAVELTSYYVNK